MADLDNLQTFYSIFSQWRFHIPDYQRGYSWGVDQWEALTDDLSTLTDNNDHFTGLLVLHENTEPKLKVRTKGIMKEVYDIVDGQQRLTTLVILLNEIRRSMEELNIGDLPGIAESITDTYLYETGPAGIPILKLNMDRNNEKYFTHNILQVAGTDITGPETQSHKNLQGAREYFHNYLLKKESGNKEEYSVWLENFYGKISNQMKVMIYKLRSEADAGVVFESMNNRGKKPNHLDLVKNYLLYLASKLGPELNPKLTDDINNTWEVIFKQLAASDRPDDEETLLQMHWFTIYDHDKKHWIKEREKSDLIKNRFSLINYLDQYEDLFKDLQDYTRTLSNSVIAYSDLRRPEQADAFQIFSKYRETRLSIVKYSQKLLRFGILRPFQPLLIATRLRFPDDSEKYLEMVKLCELYGFRVFAIAEKRTNSKEVVLFRFANQLFNGRMTFEDVCISIRRDIIAECPDNLFERSFSLENPNPWYGKRGLAYFLYEYEEFLYGKDEPKISWDAIYKGQAKSIEHILPQTPEEGSYWSNKFNLEERQTMIHQIGNLTLTVDNSSLGRKPFPDKKGSLSLKIPCYSNSNLKIEKELAALSHWTPNELEKRQKRLADWAKTRWFVEPVPPLHQSSETYSVDSLRKKAERDGWLNEFERIQKYAKTLGFGEKANKHCVSYKPRHNWNLTAFSIYTYPSGIHILIKPKHFPKFPNVSNKRIQEILGDRAYWWMTTNDVIYEFYSCLEELISEVERKKG